MWQKLFKDSATDIHNFFYIYASIALIDKTDGSDPRREEYWRKVLKTVPPYR